MSAIPNYEEFIEFYNKYPSGNPVSNYSAVKYAITQRLKPDQTYLTWDDIKNKWSQYMGYCKANGIKAQYIKKMDKWLDDQDYLSNYSGPDNYISKLKELYKIE